MKSFPLSGAVLGSTLSGLPKKRRGGEQSPRRTWVGQTIRERLSGRAFVIVSNREPYVHRKSKQGIEVERPVGGLVEALDPVMQATRGTWIAWGSGNADAEVVDGHDRIAVPPERPSYVLRRIWLPEKVVERYYYGYANQGLWPLCHMAVDKARFLRSYWAGYRDANQRFADAVTEEAESGAFVWLQDYHLALCPALIRARRPDLVLAHFWHIPWPAWDVFRACPQPQRRAILQGLLGNDLVGVHLDRFRETFLECVERELDAEVDFEHGFVDYAGRRTVVRTFPISIDVERFEQMVRSRSGERWLDRWRARPEVADRAVVAGVDRLDYTKGIPERLRAYDRFLRLHPEVHGRVVFIQKVAPSRSKIRAYQELEKTVEGLIEEINSVHGTEAWEPILYVPESMPRAAVASLYRLADVAVVSSLQDGMNLVAKEFIASQVDNRGVLVLSELSGAAEELAQAILINPFDEEGFADAIGRALSMPFAERARRMQIMRAYLREHDVYWWMEEVVGAVSELLARRSETRHLVEDFDRLRAELGSRQFALFLDYDGTIVPIAPTPAQASPSLEVRQVLRELRRRGLEVAIVSGRAAVELRDVLGVEGLTYIGNHGLEVLDGDQPPARESAEHVHQLITQVVEKVKTQLEDVPGVILEDKGLTAAIHYRLVDPAAVDRVKQVVQRAVADARPEIRLTRGKKVLEVRPALPWDKGRAVMWWLQTRFGPDWRERIVPIYVGDDRTDEDAFVALAGRGITVAVAPEGPTAASHYLRDPGEVLEFLRQVLMEAGDG